MNPILFDQASSNKYPGSVWSTLAAIIAKGAPTGIKDINPIGLVGEGSSGSSMNVFNRSYNSNVTNSGGTPDGVDLPGDDVSSQIPTSQLEDVTDAGTLLGSALSGNVHAEQLISSLGLGEATAAVTAANALGEGNLNIAAAQSLAQQAALNSVGLTTVAETGMGGGATATAAASGTTPMAGSGMAAGYWAVPVAQALYGAMIIDMHNSNEPNRMAPHDVLDAAEGATSGLTGDFRIVEQEGTRYLYDETASKYYGQDVWYNLDDENFIESERKLTGGIETYLQSGQGGGVNRQASGEDAYTFAQYMSDQGVDFSGLSSSEIMKLVDTRWDEYSPDKDAAVGGLG
jgi:hypothetical protein